MMKTFLAVLMANLLSAAIVAFVISSATRIDQTNQVLTEVTPPPAHTLAPPL